MTVPWAGPARYLVGLRRRWTLAFVVGELVGFLPPAVTGATLAAIGCPMLSSSSGSPRRACSRGQPSGPPRPVCSPVSAGHQWSTVGGCDRRGRRVCVVGWHGRRGADGGPGRLAGRPAGAAGSCVVGGPRVDGICPMAGAACGRGELGPLGVGHLWRLGAGCGDPGVGPVTGTEQLARLDARRYRRGGCHTQKGCGGSPSSLDGTAPPRTESVAKTMQPTPPASAFR
jgi:hypothetical protein